MPDATPARLPHAVSTPLRAHTAAALDHVTCAPHEAWRALSPLTVATLDQDFMRRVAFFPDLVGALVERVVVRAKRTGDQYAVATFTGVEQRLHVTLWHLAERWGRVRPDGVVVRVPLTHELLGLLVGARRPSVTAALGRLYHRGLVVPQLGRGWLLRGEPPTSSQVGVGAGPSPLASAGPAD